MYNGYPHNGVVNGWQNGPSTNLRVGQNCGINGENGNISTNGLVQVTIINTAVRESENGNRNSQRIAKSLSFLIRNDDTVAMLKSMIVAETQYGAWPDKCVLYFQGQNLCDEKKLIDHGIRHGQATLLMVSRLEKVIKRSPSSGSQVLIQLVSKSTFKIDVDWSSDLIEDIKNKVAIVLRTSVNRFELRYKNVLMKNGELISRYMTPGSLPTIEMVTDDDIREEETGNLKIIIEVEHSGELIPIESIHDKIAGLKHQIEIRTNIPKEYQKLYFQGNELGDDSSLRGCDLKRGNVILLKTIAQNR